MAHLYNSKPKILIVELNYHAEILLTLCDLLREHYDLIVVSTEKIWRKTNLKADDIYALALKPKRESIASFWRRQSEVLSQADLIYFNTLEKNLKFFSGMEFKAPTIIRVHNAHTELAPWQTIDWRPKFWPGIAGYIAFTVVLRRRWYLKRILIDKASQVMLPNSAIADYVRQKNWLENQKIADFSLPFSFLAPEMPRNTAASTVVKIAVLGSVDVRRKSYDILYLALKSIKDLFNVPVELLFLGEIKGDTGRQVVEQFDALQARNFRFRTSGGYVTAEEMERYMTEVNFLIAPIKVATRFKINYEVYGQSKASGVENDIIRYRKPALVTADYRISKELEPVCESFADSADLAKKLIHWINDGIYKDRFLRFSELNTYRKDVVLRDFAEFADRLMRQKHLQD